MDDQSTCWRCGEPRDGDGVCDLCGAVPARARAKVGTVTGGAAMLGSLAPPRPVDLAPPPPPGSLPPPRPEDRVAGPAAPPPPLGPPLAPLPPLLPPSKPVRHLWWLKIALSVGVAVVGFGIRLAIRDATGSDRGQLRRADTPSAFEGKCINVAGTRVMTVSCSETHVGRVLGVVDRSELCPDGTFDAVVVRSDPTKRLCIGPG